MPVHSLALKHAPGDPRQLSSTLPVLTSICSTSQDAPPLPDLFSLRHHLRDPRVTPPILTTNCELREVVVVVVRWGGGACFLQVYFYIIVKLCFKPLHSFPVLTAFPRGSVSQSCFPERAVIDLHAHCVFFFLFFSLSLLLTAKLHQHHQGPSGPISERSPMKECVEGVTEGRQERPGGTRSKTEKKQHLLLRFALSCRLCSQKEDARESRAGCQSVLLRFLSASPPLCLLRLFPPLT